MRLRTRALLWAAAAAVTCLVVFVLLPPLPAVAPDPSWRASTSVARGVFHVHTRRSDGTGSVDEVAAAAAEAGLEFVIITDHGDATRQPDPPAYRSGVLCIDAVEISTAGGHYAALGLGAAPYPLGGEPRDVADDVRRFGGFGIVTHPLSPKPGLTWTGWDAEVDAIEWLNGDSVWRDAPLLRLIGAGWAYPFRSAASLGTLVARPDALARWDELASRGRVVGLAGADAHARLGFSDGHEPYVSPVYLRVPSYRATFEVASMRVRLRRPLERHAQRDAAAVVEAIRAGHVHTVVDAFARSAAFEFTATSGGASAGEGDRLAATDPAVIRVRANQPAGGWIVLFRNGEQVHRVAAGELVYASDRGGAYRAEVWLPSRGAGAAVPWIVGNPIYIGEPARRAAPTPVDESGPALRLEPGDRMWGTERDGGSVAELEQAADAVGLRYTLSPAPESSPYAALNATTTVPSGAAGIAFRGRADRPMRLSVQVRVVTAGEGKRWQRSVYLDDGPRDVVIPFSDMRPVGALASGPPEVGELRTVLFVVDTVNERRGASGRFVLEEVRFFAPGPSGDQVRTVSRRNAAPAPNSRFGVHAASQGVTMPSEPTTPKTLLVVQ